VYNHAVSLHILHQELDVKFVLSRALEKAYHVWRCGPLNNWKETSAVLCKVAMVHGSKGILYGYHRWIQGERGEEP